MELFKKVVKEIEENRISSALNEISNFVNSLDNNSRDIDLFQNSIIILKREFLELESSILNNTISVTDKDQQFSSICVRILNLTRKINPPISEIKSRDFKFQFYNYENDSTSLEFQKDYEFIYQSFKIGKRRNRSYYLVEKIEERLILNYNKQEEIWIDDESQFGKIYTNTSVLYFLIQLGYSLEDELCSKSVEYLDSIRRISIENRAKFYFDIQTNRINRSVMSDFLDVLESYQLKGNGYFVGGFKPFLQGGEDKNLNPTKLPRHYGGYTFHCCLVSDVLLHINVESQSLIKKAQKILNGTASFLEQMYKDNDGWLLDGNLELSPQFSTWFVYLSKYLGIKLNGNWKNILNQSINLELNSMFKKALLVMNISLILISRSADFQKTELEDYKKYFKNYLRELELYLSDKSEKINNRDYSLFGRSIIYINKAVGNNFFYR